MLAKLHTNYPGGNFHDGFLAYHFGCASLVQKGASANVAVSKCIGELLAFVASNGALLKHDVLQTSLSVNAKIVENEKALHTVLQPLMNACAAFTTLPRARRRQERMELGEKLKLEKERNDEKSSTILDQNDEVSSIRKND